MSNTTTDCEIFGSGFSGASDHRFLDLGWVLMNRAPPPGPVSLATSLKAYCVFFLGAVPMSEMVSSPRWPVAQTGPYLGWLKLAPRPGWGILPTSVRPASLPSLASIATTLDRKSTRLNSSHHSISYAVFCL